MADNHTLIKNVSSALSARLPGDHHGSGVKAGEDHVESQHCGNGNALLHVTAPRRTRHLPSC
jgi:hypothetical protein